MNLKSIIIFLLLFSSSGLFAQKDTLDIVFFGQYERLNVNVFHKDSLIKEIKYRKNVVRPGFLLRYSIPKHSRAIHIKLLTDTEMIKKDSIELTVFYKKPIGFKYNSKTIKTDLQLEKKYLMIFSSKKCIKYCLTPEWRDEMPGWE
jgi:hypothetical protein